MELMEAHVYVLPNPDIFWGKFNNFLRLRALFGTIFRVMVFNKIREVRWHVVSIVLFLNFFVGKLHNLVRFIELLSKLYMHNHF